MTVDEIQLLNKLVVGKKLPNKEAKKVLERLQHGDLTDKQYAMEVFLSPEALRYSLDHAQDFHLYYSHYARLRVVSSLLPQADVILDLGGANGSIYRMGYPYKFKKITVVDLPPADRNEMYKHLEMKPQKTPNGLIGVHFGDMSDLHFAKDNSVDLVWSGESIEHVSEEAGERTIQEAMRVLKPGGYFCLDTPNRAITKIHTAWRGGDFVNPDHKIEYYPGQPADAERGIGLHDVL